VLATTLGAVVAYAEVCSFKATKHFTAFCTGNLLLLAVSLVEEGLTIGMIEVAYTLGLIGGFYIGALFMNYRRSVSTDSTWVFGVYALLVLVVHIAFIMWQEHPDGSAKWLLLMYPPFFGALDVETTEKPLGVYATMITGCLLHAAKVHAGRLVGKQRTPADTRKLFYGNHVIGGLVLGSLLAVGAEKCMSRIHPADAWFIVMMPVGPLLWLTVVFHANKCHCDEMMTIIPSIRSRRREEPTSIEEAVEEHSDVISDADTDEEEDEEAPGSKRGSPAATEYAVESRVTSNASYLQRIAPPTNECAVDSRVTTKTTSVQGVTPSSHAHP